MFCLKMGSFALVALSIWAAMKDWPYNVLFGALCIDWIFGALIDLIHDLPDIDRWGVKADERHLLRELQHLILGRGRVFFVTRQFDPGNARFTYRQINSIDRNWARNADQFFLRTNKLTRVKSAPLLLSISSLWSGRRKGFQKGVIRERTQFWTHSWLEREPTLGQIRIDSRQLSGEASWWGDKRAKFPIRWRQWCSFLIWK